MLYIKQIPPCASWQPGVWEEKELQNQSLPFFPLLPCSLTVFQTRKRAHSRKLPRVHSLPTHTLPVIQTRSHTRERVQIRRFVFPFLPLFPGISL